MIKDPEFGAEESKVYGEALDTLNQAGIRYMVGGIFTVNAYTGIWRDTKDLDVFVPEESVPRVLDTLEGAGFETAIEDPCWLAKAWKGEFFLDLVHANHNGTGQVEDSWFDNAKEISLLGRRTLVVPAEEMLISKMFVVAKDRCDVDDVLHLVFGTRGDLDWDRVLDKVGEHWELLLAYLHFYRYVYPSHIHYVPRGVFEVLERYKREAGTAPQNTLRFRGTMLDEEAFSVDVEEWGLPDEREAIREARCSDEEQGKRP